MTLEQQYSGQQRSALVETLRFLPISGFSGLSTLSIYQRKHFSMIKKILVGAMFSGATFAAQAQSAGFSIAGTITPSPCTISLGNGGVNDFGSLSKGSLSFDSGHSYRPPQQGRMSLAVICSAPTKFALAFTDNRDGTAIATPDVPGDRHFGLGTYNGQNIGNARFYAGGLKFKTTVGGALQTPAGWLMTTGVAGSNSSWAYTGGHLYFPKGKSIVFVARANATAPDALTEVSGQVNVGLNLSKSVVDTATSNIQFDGSGTVTLIML